MDPPSVRNVLFTFDFVLGQAGDGHSNNQNNHADHTDPAELPLAEWAQYAPLIKLLST